MRKYLSAGGIVISLLVLLGIMGFARENAAALVNAAEMQSSLQPAFVPGPHEAQILGMGFDTLFSDMLWLSSVQYIGEHFRDSNYPQLETYLRTITALDPSFQAAYKTALLLLPDVNATQAATDLGLIGVQKLPDDPELPFYLAYIYFEYEKNYPEAAKWFTYAANVSHPLPSARSLAAVNLAQAGEFEVAREVWQNIYATQKDEETKNRALVKIVRYSNFIVIRDAMRAYEKKFGVLPETIQQLTSTSFLPRLPRDPLPGMTYVINPKTHQPDVQLSGAPKAAQTQNK